MKSVSVIIPTYKRNDYILRALESVLQQDYSEIEIVVVDDNGEGTECQKNTEQKLELYIRSKKIKYIVNKANVGGSKARNNGIQACSGHYVTFLDDDDVYLQGKIKKQVQAMEEYGWDLCVMDDETYNNKGERLSYKRQPIENGMTLKEMLKAHITKHITGTNDFMYTRDAIVSIGMFDDITAGQEYMLMQKSITSGLKIGIIHEVLVHFHMDGQERISTNLNKVEGLNKIYEEKKKYFPILSRDEVAYVKSKHFGTVFYVYYANRKYLKAGTQLIRAFCSSPKYTWETFLERRGKLKLS